ncbi:Uncharacterised protein [Streptococcus pyogenes]|uniref:hypothetical protein n=1 Tax=Streptococcus pyogenes TaxID=1314 RepID=UPI0010A147A2|nr:hypothetical protein [Streptococcus pyogenes]VHD88871.1 Uncharacterised protein [Streptococcus pyogenes]
MKTKSKRFLNLATLCLALLGTTLLMAQPVKAEEPKRERDRVVEDQEKKMSPYQRGLRDGQKPGYERGKQDKQQKQNESPDASPTPPERHKVEVPEPENNPYHEDSDKQRYKTGWNTAYLSSYYNGWFDEGPGRLESDDDSNEEEGKDISGSTGSTGSTDSTGSTGSTDSTDASFSSIIDMIVEVTELLFWGLVSSLF